MKITIIRRTVLLTVVSLAIAVWPQQTGKPITAKKSKAANTATPAQSTDDWLPSQAEVDSFLRHMFGYNPAATWKIIDIKPSEAPRVAHIIAVLGNNPTATHLYVTPDGKNVVVGDMIPFGANPYAETNATLLKDTSAPVTIVEFSDLQCPYCKSAQPIIDKLLEEKPNTRLVFQHFPLPMHIWAMKAAAYGQCVADQNPAAFWKFVQGVYDAQESVNEGNVDEKLTAIATAAGADGARAAACSAQPNTLAQVQVSIDLGKSVGVGGTPTVFINGRKISAIKEVPFDTLKAMVDYEASQSKLTK